MEFRLNNIVDWQCYLSPPVRQMCVGTTLEPNVDGALSNPVIMTGVSLQAQEKYIGKILHNSILITEDSLVTFKSSHPSMWGSLVYSDDQMVWKFTSNPPFTELLSSQTILSKPRLRPSVSKTKRTTASIGYPHLKMRLRFLSVCIFET